jgi:Rrf2 family protein
MPMNTRFAVAVHILTFLHTQGGQPATSDLIASSVNTNPSLIRRLLSRLAQAGLTTSQMGAGGGALLAQPADTITLLDVYRVVDDDRKVILVHASPNLKCPVGRHIRAVLETRIDAAERALEQELTGTSIAELAGDVTRRERRRGVRARTG